MPDTSIPSTLPQLLDGYRKAVTDGNTNRMNELVRLTYYSTVIEGSSLTFAQTRNLIRNGQPILDKPLTDQGRIIDHHQALEQILSMASQREPLNRNALQEVAATLMAQSGGLIYSLLSSFDTRQGDLRIDSAMVGRRIVVAAHKLPAAIDELLKGINTRIHQLHTPRQVYDLSFETHFQLLTLHPFGAGNGPMARLLMNYVQHYHQLPLSQVYVGSRAAYLSSLESSWSQKTTVPIVDFMHSQLLRLLAEGLARSADEQDLD
ncbi:filamentation induced by cAMP protein fic [Spirosoma aureum]|uniref:Filamentation induced by cAMP protein fic n=1 Tax=Spirosoma aureum TaxID=2692134 RepID=A0A6G9AN28_9BACT|nr:Fic family protein [Spirosoma aureum]QIP13746.1 filamentation induced by cAMP protein fic [Spirosoma aureum]